MTGADPILDGSPYQQYLYAYPHKTSYRRLQPRPALADVWRGEARDALFLYIHVPFCEMRCGFCNLFTRANAPTEQVGAYLRQVRRQAEQVARALDGSGERARYARAAFGGGTPTYVSLSHLPHVARVVIQTNLAVRVDWLADADARTAALWATYHPGQVSRDRFLRRCARLSELGIRYSVGVVGLPEHLAEARALRAALPETVYLWVNAAEGRRYDAAEEAAWTELDPYFGYSIRPHLSLGQPCHAGESVVSVLGDGTVRRCHFIPAPIGNLYDGSWRAALKPRPCTNRICDCHIGYVHLKPLRLYDVFAGGSWNASPRRGRHGSDLIGDRRSATGQWPANPRASV